MKPSYALIPIVMVALIAFVVDTERKASKQHEADTLEKVDLNKTIDGYREMFIYAAECAVRAQARLDSCMGIPPTNSTFIHEGTADDTAPATVIIKASLGQSNGLPIQHLGPSAGGLPTL